MELVPGNSLITKTPEDGRALALLLARHSIHAMQPDLEVLKQGRPKYSTDPDGLQLPYPDDREGVSRVSRTTTTSASRPLAERATARPLTPPWMLVQ